MKPEFNLHPGLARAMNTWLDLDDPDRESREGLLKLAVGCAVEAAETMTDMELNATVRWIEDYVVHEDRSITHVLCDAANCDWSISPQCMAELHFIMKAILDELKGWQRHRTAPSWSEL